MQLQGLPAGNRTRVLWITRPVLYHRATEAVADYKMNLTLNLTLNLHVSIAKTPRSNLYVRFSYERLL